MAGRVVTDALMQLLAAIRRRLWTASILRGVYIGSWWIAGAALALGLVHRFASAVPAWSVFAFTLLPGVAIVLVASARGRPSLDECARTADRVFGGRELIASAWELSRAKPADSDGGLLVLYRAAAAAAGWLPGLPSLRPALPSAGIPLALLCAGAFLLANQGAPSATPVAEGGTALVTSDSTDSSVTFGTGTPTAEVGTAQTRVRPMRPSDAPSLPEAFEDDDGPSPLLLPSPPRAGSAGGGETGKLATAGRPAVRPDGATDFPEMELRLISVESVLSAPQLSVGSGAADLDPDGDDAADAGSGSAVAVGGLRDWNRFSPSERRFLADVFEDRDGGETESAR